VAGTFYRLADCRDGEYNFSAASFRAEAHMMAMLKGYMAWLCKIFGVTPDTLRNGRRGNLPPPSGGIAS